MMWRKWKEEGLGTNSRDRVCVCVVMTFFFSNETTERPWQRWVYYIKQRWTVWIQMYKSAVVSPRQPVMIRTFFCSFWWSRAESYWTGVCLVWSESPPPFTSSETPCSHLWHHKVKECVGVGACQIHTNHSWTTAVWWRESDLHKDSSVHIFTLIISLLHLESCQNLEISWFWNHFVYPDV